MIILKWITIKVITFVNYLLNFDLSIRSDHAANIGENGKKVDQNLQDLWILNITTTIGMVNKIKTPSRINTVISGENQLEKLITHLFKLNKIMIAN